jgi:hypothetical protein
MLGCTTEERVPEPPAERLDYQRILKEALRDAVRRVLEQVAAEGLPGDHYFYIAFHADHPDVEMSRELRERYPGEMTIILQHQYWNLVVGADAFAVELSFNGSQQRVSVPWTALTAFIDPSADFALRFEGVSAAATRDVVSGPAADRRSAARGRRRGSPVREGAVESPAATETAAGPPDEEPPPGASAGVIPFAPRRRR